MTMQTYVFCEYLSENEKFHEIVLKFLKYFSSSIELTQAPDKPYKTVCIFQLSTYIYRGICWHIMLIYMKAAYSTWTALIFQR